MLRYARKLTQKGFTLIEILVTLILLGILAALLFPVVTQQIEEGDPVRTANDLVNIRTGIETFSLNVRPAFPGDLEDLVYTVSSSGDVAMGGAAYSNGQVNRWNGPYIDAALAEEGAATTAEISTGFSGNIQADLVCYDAATATNAPVSPETDCARGHFVAVQIDDLGATEFEAINDLVDGEGEDDTSTTDTDERHSSGKLRWDSSGEVAYYLAVPFRK